MFGLGGTEALIIAAIVLLLFAPTLLAFWFGFVLGQKRGAEKPETATTPAPERARARTAPGPAPMREATPAPPVAADGFSEDPHDE